METQSFAASDLDAQAWRYLVHTLYTLLPPPEINTPEALLARNNAAVAKIVALSPVNASEADLAAKYVVAGAQADDVMRLIRWHSPNPHTQTGDTRAPGTRISEDTRQLMRLQSQYNAMVRTSLAAHGHLLREQKQRCKQEATAAGADAAAWIRHIAANAMLNATPIEPEVSVSEEFQKTDTESHNTVDETPERQPASQSPHPIVNLCRTHATWQDAEISARLPLAIPGPTLLTHGTASAQRSTGSA